MRIKIKVNRIIKYLVLSDLAFWSGWGLITPVFAIFIVDKITGGSVFVVGMAAAIGLIGRSLFRIPMGMFLDRCHGERDDYWFLVVGLFIAALVPFGYVFAVLPWHIYLLQAIFGLSIAMSCSGWAAIFTRHIDKGKEATEWGLGATSVTLGAGVAGAVGGWAVSRFGFDPVFITVGILGLVGVGLLLFLKNDIKGVFDHGLHFSFRDIFHSDGK